MMYAYTRLVATFTTERAQWYAIPQLLPPIRKLLQMLKDHEISSGLHHMARYSAKIRDLEGTLDLGQLRN
jgi:hypothetical protein